MAFALPDHWVWDFWLADDGQSFHMYYLHAPKSLGDPDLRHRNARIGHAVSNDLVNWQDRGPVLTPGLAGSFDGSATWTGSVIRGPDRRWRMYYTGSRFLSPDSNANVETIGLAVSDDLHEWHKEPGPILRADPRWYETLGSSTWPEEAWRDPWVYRDPDGQGWHMLITARTNEGPDTDRGVVGHATSNDLDNWTAQPPLSVRDTGFDHLEVLQLVEIEGKNFILFCCDAPKLVGPRKGEQGGVWAMPAKGARGPFDPSAAYLIAPWPLYAGRLVQDREGRWVLLAFEADTGAAGFAGRVTNPMPLSLDDAGRITIHPESAQ
jgi:beta-fructofuranosidase